MKNSRSGCPFSEVILANVSSVNWSMEVENTHYYNVCVNWYHGVSTLWRFSISQRSVIGGFTVIIWIWLLYSVQRWTAVCQRYQVFTILILVMLLRFPVFLLIIPLVKTITTISLPIIALMTVGSRALLEVFLNCTIIITIVDTICDYLFCAK